MVLGVDACDEFRAEVCAAEVRAVEVRAAEVCATRSAPLRFARLRFARLRFAPLRSSFPGSQCFRRLVPCLDPCLEFCELFSFAIGRTISELFIATGGASAVIVAYALAACVVFGLKRFDEAVEVRVVGLLVWFSRTEVRDEVFRGVRRRNLSDVGCQRVSRS